MKNKRNKDIACLETSANTVFVGNYVSPNPPSADFTNTENVERNGNINEEEISNADLG